MGVPLTTDEFISRHKADLQACGFDIQFIAFVNFLLDIKGGDVIEYEKEDDIVVSCTDGTKWFIQVKNSVRDNAKMTDADDDFWKTFDNWLSLYDLSESKKDFLKYGNRFILYTNKILSNSFYEQIKNLRDGSCGIKDVISFLNSVKNTVSYYSTIEKLLGMDGTDLNRFLHKVEVMQVTNPMKALYEKFLEIYNKPTKADLIVSELLGKLYTEKINAAKNNETLSYEKTNFLNKYRGILQKVSDESLVSICDDVIELPKDVKDIPFIKYLDEIDVLNLPDSIEEYYGNWFCYNRSVQYYYSVQLMTPELEKSMNSTAKSNWYNIFRHKHIKVNCHSSDAEKIDAAQNCFYEVMNERISFDNARSIYPPFSSGWFLNMTNDKDHPYICWHIDVLPKLKKKV
mgnify:CR=1 FL=1